MQHYQIRLACGLCQRAMVIDVVSWGSPHQSVQSVTCFDCAEKAGVPLLPEGKIQELKTVQVGEPITAADMEHAFESFKAAQKTGEGQKN